MKRETCFDKMIQKYRRWIFTEAIQVVSDHQQHYKYVSPMDHELLEKLVKARDEEKK